MHGVNRRRQRGSPDPPVLVDSRSLNPLIRSLFSVGGRQLTWMLLLLHTASSNSSSRSTCCPNGKVWLAV
jgi:hypothetical protein